MASEETEKVQEPAERSEDVLGRKWDRCLSDTAIKVGTGAGLGVIFSLLLFKKRPWPVALGTGIGLGMGYSNCQHDLAAQGGCCRGRGPPWGKGKPPCEHFGKCRHRGSGPDKRPAEEGQGDTQASANYDCMEPKK